MYIFAISLMYYIIQFFIIVILFLVDKYNQTFQTKLEFFISLIPLGFLYPITMRVIEKLKNY